MRRLASRRAYFCQQSKLCRHVRAAGPVFVAEALEARRLLSVSFAPAVNYPVGSEPQAVAAGDFSGNGKTDLAVANFNSSNVSVLMGNGNGTFQAAVNYAAGSRPNSVAVGDFNGDGKTDLVVVNDVGMGVGSTVSVLLGNGDGTFQAPVSYATGIDPFAIAVGEFTGDGKEDLAVANTKGGVSVLRGNGNGTFQAPVSYAAGSGPTSIAVGDFNGDGKADLAVADGSGGVSVLMGNGNGSFQAPIYYPTGNFPFSVTAGDCNGDGKPDLAVANMGDGNVSVLLGNGNGTFQAAVNYAIGDNPMSITAGDFDFSGSDDLVVADGNTSVCVLEGNGDGTFQSPINFATGNYSYSVTVGDFNGDGKPDLAVSNAYDNTVSVLLNTTFWLPTPAFSNLSSSSSINYGTTSATVSGSISAGSLIPSTSETIAVTLDGVTQSAAIGPHGSFSSTFNTGALPASLTPYQVTYAYAGDANLNPCKNAVTTKLTVVGTSTTTAITTSSAVAAHGQPVTFTAKVTPASGSGVSGTVQFQSDGGDVGSPVPIGVNGTATCAITTLSIGSHAIVAIYSGAGAFTGSTSAALTQIVISPNGNGFLAPVTYAAGSEPFFVAEGDFNGDGKLDLAVANRYSANVSILLGNGDGTFQAAVNYAAGSDPDSIAVGDFNGDGKEDLAVADCNSNGGVSVLLGNGNGTFQTPASYGLGANNSYATSVAEGDFNGDGKIDLVMANDGEELSVLLGNGNGTFQSAATNSEAGVEGTVTVGDFNNDGKTDLAITNSFYNWVGVLLGNGNGTFQTGADYTVSSPFFVAAGDFNGDGKADLVVTDSSGVSVLTGNGGGTFQAPVSYAAGTDPEAVSVGDFNGDGIADLAVPQAGIWTGSTYAGQGVNILLGNGNGSFQTAVNYAAGNEPRSVAVGDFNGDGKPDLAVADYGGGVSVLLNASAMVTPVFANLSAPSSVNAGTPSVTFSGSIAAGSLIPAGTETVAITLNGVTQNAAIDSQGNFSSTFNTSALPASTTPYQVTYSYAGDASFIGVTDSTTTTLTVANIPAWVAASSNAAIWNATTQTLTITGNAAITADPSISGVDPVIIESGNASQLVVDTLIADGGDGDAVVHIAAISGNGTTTVNAGSSLDVGNCSQAALVNDGTVEIDGTGGIGQITGSGNLTIGNGTSNNTVRLAPVFPANSVSNTQTAVNISSGSTLDMTDNTLMLNYGNCSSPLAAVQSGVASGSITSSIANPGGQYTVGYADATEMATVPSGNVELMYTLAGDVRLAGSANFLDYSALQNSYNQSGRDWTQGDFNHDGTVNFDDYSLLQNSYGQSVMLTPIITWSTPAAIEYGTPLSATQLDASTAMPGTFAYNPTLGTMLRAGIQNLTVTFIPTDTTDYYSPVYGNVSLVVNKATTTTLVTSSNRASTYGQGVVFTATITPASGSDESGSVQFQIDGGNAGAPVTVGGDTVTYSAPALAAGSHVVVAVYSGDTNFAGSSSPVFTQTVSKITTMTVVTSSNNASLPGQAVTFTATVTPASLAGETGTVQFQIDGGNVGTPVTLTGNTATYTTSTLANANHTVAAVYSGDGNFAGSTSPAFYQHVGPLPPTVTYTMSINDDGTGHYCAGHFAVYAADTTNNGGLASYDINLAGTKTITNFSPKGNYDDGTGCGNMDEIGFTVFRTANNVAPITASQDTAGYAGGGEVVLVYGIGQTAGNLAADALPGSTGAGGTMQTVYGAPVELIKGTFTSGVPSLTSTTQDTCNVFITNSSYGTEASVLAFSTVTVVNGTVSQAAAGRPLAGASSSAAAAWPALVGAANESAADAAYGWSEEGILGYLL